MLTRTSYFTVGGIVLAFILFVGGMSFGKSRYTSSLIATKYIDGKYGRAFYCVEVTGREEDGWVKVYAKIHIGGLNAGYWHDCGKIGSAKGWPEARKRFGDIEPDEKGISIGLYRLEREEYENHR